MNIVINGTFDQVGVERWVADICGSQIGYSVVFADGGVTVSLPDNLDQDTIDTIRRVVRANRYPFRKVYTGTFRPERLSAELSAFGVSIENCTEATVSIVYEMPDDGLPAGFEAALDSVISGHNPNYVSPEEAHRQVLKNAWAQYAGLSIASLPLEDLTQIVILYLSLNTNAIAPDGTIRPLT